MSAGLCAQYNFGRREARPPSPDARDTSRWIEEKPFSRRGGKSASKHPTVGQREMFGTWPVYVPLGDVKLCFARFAANHDDSDRL